MSIFTCGGCEEQVDSDRVDCIEHNEKLWCQDCWGPNLWAKHDAELGGYDNRYPFDLDPLSDYQIYDESHRFYSMRLPISRQIESFFRRA